MQGLSGEFVFEEVKLEILTNNRQLTKKLGNRFGIIHTTENQNQKNSGVEIKGMLNQFRVVMQS